MSGWYIRFFEKFLKEWDIQQKMRYIFHPIYEKTGLWSHNGDRATRPKAIRYQWFSLHLYRLKFYLTVVTLGMAGLSSCPRANE